MLGLATGDPVEIRTTSQIRAMLLKENSGRDSREIRIAEKTHARQRGKRSSDKQTRKSNTGKRKGTKNQETIKPRRKRKVRSSTKKESGYICMGYKLDHRNRKKCYRAQIMHESQRKPDQKKTTNVRSRKKNNQSRNRKTSSCWLYQGSKVPKMALQYRNGEKTRW